MGSCLKSTLIRVQLFLFHFGLFFVLLLFCVFFFLFFLFVAGPYANVNEISTLHSEIFLKKELWIRSNPIWHLQAWLLASTSDPISTP